MELAKEELRGSNLKGMKNTHLFPKFLISLIPLFLFVTNGCYKTKSPYFILDNDTIAYLISKNDSLMIAKIENRKFHFKYDSIYHKIYNYYELNNQYTTYITDIYTNPSNDSTKNIQIQYRLILNKEIDTIAFAESVSNISKNGIIITPISIKDENKLKEISSIFNLNKCKYFNSFDKGKYEMGYYAYYNTKELSFYEKPFTEDTLRILNYLSNLPGLMRFSGIDRLYTEKEIHNWALTIRNIGDLAKQCKKSNSQSIKKASENLIDSLNVHQKWFFWGLRSRYGKILERTFADYDLEIFVDEFFENTIMKASCDLFISEDYALKFLNARDNIIRALGLKKVRFSWSMRAWLDYHYPILPANEIHKNEYIGWKYDHKYNIEDILDVTSEYYNPSTF